MPISYDQRKEEKLRQEVEKQEGKKKGNAHERSQYSTVPAEYLTHIFKSDEIALITNDITE